MTLDFEAARFNMIEQQIRPWEVLDEQVLEACRKIPRELFVPEKFKTLAFSDVGLPLRCGEMMMPPKVEARLLQCLSIQPGDRVLEIGTGSGHLTALLATLAAHVTSIEIRSELHEQARGALRVAGVNNIKLHVGDGIEGWSTAEPYDVIVITGSSPERLATMENQLSLGGRMFVVLGTEPVMEACIITRNSRDVWTVETIFETSLAPLKGAERPAQFQF